MNTSYKLLLVEDNPIDALLVERGLANLSDFRCELTHVGRLQDALAALARQSFDVVLLDLYLPDAQGIQTLRGLRSACRAGAIVVLSGETDEGLRELVLREGAQDFLGKHEPPGRVLARSMLYALERRRADEQHQQIQRLVSSNPDAVIVTDHQGMVRFVNPAGLRLFGRHQEDFVGELIGFSICEGQSAEIEILRGEERCVGEMHVARLEWDGEPAFLTTIRDVTERKKAGEASREHNVRLEARVRERTTELETANAVLQCEVAERKRVEEMLRLRTTQLELANKELESFSYSVSHDLRSPLRTIDGYSRILLQDYLESLPEEARILLGMVRSSTQQMGRLVDELLAFARLGRQAIKKQSVDMAKLVRQVIEALHDEQDGRHVEILIGDLLPCEAEPSLLKQVWINLLSNAIKYTRGREVATIEIGSRDGGGPMGEPTYFVRDNGVGFDMRYAGKLFGVFQRLHRAEDYEGTGVGLAIVQRIVHRHGGRVWAEAQPDRGATFSFTLDGGHPDD